jgi:prepilin-type N-terminal cleavage/methylation domain-containing protein
VVLRKWNKNQRSRGFTLFEFAIVIAIMAVLGGAMISRTYTTNKDGEVDTNGQGQGYQAQAERAQVATIIGAVRSALHLRVAKLVTTGRERDLPGLVDENPMRWLAEVPSNYVGEYFSPKTTELPLESWYYDKKNKTLVYLYNHGRNASNPDSDVIRYKLKVMSDSGSGSNRDGVAGVVLEVVGK